MEVFENGGSASLCGRAKTEVLENDYVTGIGMSQLKKQNGCFLIRFRWCSVDGRKRCKNASVDEKLFIRFQETENGGFRKRISVDRASNVIHFLHTSLTKPSSGILTSLPIKKAATLMMKTIHAILSFLLSAGTLE